MDPPNLGPNIVGVREGGAPRGWNFFPKSELTCIQKYNKFQKITLFLSIKVYSISVYHQWRSQDFFGVGAANF